MIGAVVLLLVGLGFVLAEVFFVSMGMFGLVAGVLILWADAIAFAEGTAIGWGFVVAELILVPLAVRTAFRILPRLPFGRRMILAAPEKAGAAAVPAFAHLVGRRGRALTDLRPAGTADIDGERLSVVALGGLLPRGTSLVVESVEGSEVRVVRADVPPTSPPEPQNPGT